MNKEAASAVICGASLSNHGSGSKQGTHEGKKG